jgi:hypothetical protein
VITGRSAATVRGAPLAEVNDPVEIIAPLGRRIARRDGFDLRRNEIATGEWMSWHGGRLATSLRMVLDLALDRPVPWPSLIWTSPCGGVSSTGTR